jgi:hypothetical protein
MADGTRDMKVSDSGPDEVVELIEEAQLEGKPVSSVEKPRRGTLWGSL